MADFLKRVRGAVSLVLSGEPAAHSFAGAREADDDDGWHRASLGTKGGLGGDTLGGTTDTPNRATVVQMARRLLKKNPFLQMDYINPMSACVVGTGIKVKAKTPSVQKIVDNFMERNAIGGRFQNFLYGMLLLEGELVLPLTFGAGGNLSMTYLYTDMVEVEWSSDDNRYINKLIYQPTSSPAQSVTRVFKPIVDVTNKAEFFEELYETPMARLGVEVEDDEAEAPKDYRPKQDIAIYFKINDLAARRGLPAIFTIGDFADMFDEFVFRRLQLLQAVMRLWLDVEVTGGKTDVDRLKEVYKTIPANGAVDIHTEKIKTEVRKFSMDGTEISNDFETFKTSWGLTTGVPPRVMLGEAPIEAGSMFAKMVAVQQVTFGDVIKLLVDCQLNAKVAAGALPADADLSYELEFNEISTKDVGKLATAINQIALSLLVGIQEEFVERKDAAKAYVEAVGMALDYTLKAKTTFSEDVGAPSVPPGGMQPNGSVAPNGGAGSADAKKNPFDTYSKRGARINNMTKTKVTR